MKKRRSLSYRPGIAMGTRPLLILGLALAAAACEDLERGEPSVPVGDVPVVVLNVVHGTRPVAAEINGVPIGGPVPSRGSWALQIGPFLKSGANRITLRWEGADVPPRPIEIEVRSRVPGGEAATLAELTADEAEAARPGALTFDVDIEMPVVWSWERAAEVERLGSDDLTAITGLVEKLQDAFRRGSAEEAARLLETALRETGLMRPDAVERSREQFAGMMSETAWRVEAASPSSFEIVPHGRLVRVVAPAPILDASAGPEAGNLRFDAVYVARLEGQWTLVRVR